MNHKLKSLIGGPQTPVTSTGTGPTQTRKHWADRLAVWIPLVLLVGFFLLLWLLFGSRLLPARGVLVETVVTLRDAGQSGVVEVKAGLPPSALQFEGPALFQASGWIEPSPQPIGATALEGGIVEKVFVMEGEPVKQGQVLAKLVDADAKLNLQTARSELGLREAEMRSAKSEIRIVQAQIDTLEKRIESAEARRDEAKDLADRLSSIGALGAPEQEIVQAQLRLKAQETEVGTLQVSRNELKARILQLETELEAANHRIELSKTEVARRELSLERTAIRSPVDGIVQHLNAAPGDKKLLQTDHPKSATIAHIYEPEKLQARIDVPLEEAGGLFIGQAVRIRSAILPDHSFQGTVTRIAGEADLQRNTLQAKVRILNPDVLLRPEMLCRAEFLTGSKQGKAGNREGLAGTGPVQVFISPDALVNRSGAQAIAWKLNVGGQHVERTQLTLSETTRDEYVRVLSGLNPGDRVVLNPPADLSAGDRVRPTAQASLNN